jgi:hypothetical protein
MTYHAIMCDGCGDEPSVFPTAAECRREMRKAYGFTHHTDDVDHCKECEAKHKVGTLEPYQ